MSNPTLVILAAGMGSRYGGLKQIDTVGSNGESIIDFSIYDAIQAGFKKLILIIKKEHEQAFEEQLVSKVRPFMEVHYAYQDISDIPQNFDVPQGREKPWGTVHALLACEQLLGDDPFMVINADDYYGKASYVLMHQFLTNEVAQDHYAMVGYVLKNTLTDHGTVTRGICETKDGYLKEIMEIQKLTKKGEMVLYEHDSIWEPIDGDKVCSMNYWGFSHHIFEKIKPLFSDFLEKNIEVNPMKSEYVIPSAVGDLVNNDEIKVKVYSSSDHWYGITYQEDKPLVVAKIQEFKDTGLYPQNLWRKQ